MLLSVQTGRRMLLRGRRLQRYVAADCWRAVRVPDRLISTRAPQKVLVAEPLFPFGVMKSARMVVSLGTYASSRHVWLSCEEQAPSALGYTDARGRGLTQNRSYTPYASAQKRTPSSKEAKTGNRWRPPRNTFPKVSSRFLTMYVSFDHLS